MYSYPVEESLESLRASLQAAGCVLLKAPTGAGKTTVVPLRLLHEPWLEGRQILILEPRRIAARAAAARLAEQLGETPGGTVGYQVRMERRVSDHTRILVVTEGILTRMLQQDPELKGVGLVIFDEFHERHLHSDLAFALAKHAQELFAPSLKLLIMSATLDEGRISTQLGHIPVVVSEGRSWPVTISYLSPQVRQPDRYTLTTMAKEQILSVIPETEGDMLVFMPGAKEIASLAEDLNRALRGQPFQVAPLYGALSFEAQVNAVKPAPDGVRKIVVATNIAESSLTIPGIRVVVDGGLERRAYFHQGRGMSQMETVQISTESADQRAGRAGRTAPGACYRLWHEHHALPLERTPEILMGDVTQLLLELAIWGAAPDELTWLDPPPSDALERSHQLLLLLGALTAEGEVTPHGKELAQFGLPPRLGHLIVRGMEAGHLAEAALLAALLSERDIFTGAETRSSDILLRFRRVRAEGATRSSAYKYKQVRELARLFERRARSLRVHTVPSQPFSEDMVGRLLVHSFPDRVARLRDPHGSRYLLSSGRGATLRPGDDQLGSEWLVVPSLDGAGQEARIFLSAALPSAAVNALLSDHLVEEAQVTWNQAEGRVESYIFTKIGAIPLQRRPYPDAPQEQVQAAFCQGVRSKGPSAFSWSLADERLISRVAFLRHLHANHPDLFRNLELPLMDTAALMGRMEQWLLPAHPHLMSLEQLRKVSLTALLKGQLSWEQRKMLDELAPEKVSVPSGSTPSIAYDDPAAPVLAVRLQELFGMRCSPSVGKGLVPVVLHILSPAGRPIQITSDLESFWKNGYQAVRRELRGKYKKHYWPEDPYTAIATNKTKRALQREGKID